MARRNKKGKAPSKPTPRYSTPKWPGPNSNGRQAQDATPRFSLREEAQWMSSHKTGAFDSTKKLRNMPIQFVSAGLLQGTLKEPAAPTEPAAPPSPSPLDDDNLAQMTIRHPSPSPSNASAASSSSEEVVVFKGRGQAALAHSPQPAASLTLPHQSLQVQHESTVDPALAKSPGNVTLSLRQGTAASAPLSSPNTTSKAVKPNPASNDESDVDSDTNSVVDIGFSKRRGSKPIWEGHRVDWVSRSKPGIGWLPMGDRPDMDAFFDGPTNSRDAAMDDYMQNVEDFGLTGDMLAAAKLTGFASREMDLDGGSHNDWEDANPQSIAGDEDGEHGEENELDGWTSDHLRDLGDLSTSEDADGVISRVLLKRTRVTGLQYLVVYEDEVADDARWLPASSLKSASELELIRRFEAKQPVPISSSDESDTDFFEEHDDEDEDDEDKDEDQDDDDDEDDDEEGDEELDDETIARVLQKQEELGLGSDEMLLYAADEYFARPGSGRGSAASRSFGYPKAAGRQRRAGGGRRDPTFPSASAMADALSMDPYGAFDIMDTNRPSLRPKKKGRRGQMPPELDDSDLNEQLQATWANDRNKKRLKKAEREKLRKEGLLGRKGKAPDLSVKYKDGVDMVEITEEIREFMISGMQTLSLPPMDAHYRAVIHQFVKSLGVNSKSRGNGAARFTVLSKTQRTPTFNHDHFDNVFGNRFRVSWARGGKQSGDKRRAPAPRAGGGRSLRPQTGYKDGEIVGASAPELGPENRGRALMEKMGWSKGMALGATDNKGILQPIAHVVKTNKAGLQ